MSRCLDVSIESYDGAGLPSPSVTFRFDRDQSVGHDVSCNTVGLLTDREDGGGGGLKGGSERELPHFDPRGGQTAEGQGGQRLPWRPAPAKQRRAQVRAGARTQGHPVGGGRAGALPALYISALKITSFYGSSCANNGKGALNTPDLSICGNF
eukprot:1184024-Prorocentrum_minimum.AAC.3